MADGADDVEVIARLRAEDNATTIINNFNNAVKDTGAASSEAGAQASGLGGIVSGLGGAFQVAFGQLIAGAVQGVIQDVKDFAGGIVEAASQAQDTMAQLNVTLKDTGATTGVTTGLVDQLAEKFAGLTTYSDESIKAAEEITARFRNISAETFPLAIQAATDMAAKMGIDLPSAAMALDRALATPGTGLLRLKAYGIEFTAAQDKVIQKMAETGDMAGAQKEILDALAGSVGGSATAAAGTFSGQLAILHNSLQMVQEAFEPVLGDIAGIIKALNDTGAITKFADGLKAVLSGDVLGGAAGMGAGVSKLMTFLGFTPEAASLAQAWVTNTVTQIQKTITGLISGLKTGGLGGALGAILPPETVAEITKAITTIQNAFTFLENALKPLFTWISQNGKIVTGALAGIGGALIIGGIIALGTAIAGLLGSISPLIAVAAVLGAAWSGNWLGIRQIVTDAIMFIETDFKIFKDLFTGNWYQLGYDIGNLWGTLWGQVQTDWQNLWPWIENIAVTAFNDILQALVTFGDTVVGFFSTLVSDIVNFIQHPASTDWHSLGTSIMGDLYNGIASLAGQIEKLGGQIGAGFSAGLANSIKIQLSGTGALAGVTGTLTAAAAGTGAALENAYHNLGGEDGPVQTALTQLASGIGKKAGAIKKQVTAMQKALQELGAIAGLGSAADATYKKEVLDPLDAVVKGIDDKTKAVNDTLTKNQAEYNRLQNLYTSGQLSPDEMVEAKAAMDKLNASNQDAQKQLLTLDQQKTDAAKAYADAQAKSLELAKEQQKVSFLDEQLKLLGMIKDYKLDSKSILGGLKIGMDADSGEVLAAIERAMTAMIDKANKTLGIASESKVFAEMGKLSMAGYSKGLLDWGSMPALAAAQVAGNVSTAYAKNLSINAVFNNNTPAPDIVIDRLSNLAGSL